MMDYSPWLTPEQRKKYTPPETGPWVPWSLMGTVETEEVDDQVFVHTFNPLPDGTLFPEPWGHVERIRSVADGDGNMWLEVEVQLTPEAYEHLFGPPWWKRMLSLKAWSKVIALVALDKITRPFGGA